MPPINFFSLDFFSKTVHVLLDCDDQLSILYLYVCRAGRGGIIKHEYLYMMIYYPSVRTHNDETGHTKHYIRGHIRKTEEELRGISHNSIITCAKRMCVCDSSVRFFFRQTEDMDNLWSAKKRHGSTWRVQLPRVMYTKMVFLFLVFLLRVYVRVVCLCFLTFERLVILGEVSVISF